MEPVEDDQMGCEKKPVVVQLVLLSGQDRGVVCSRPVTKVAF